MLVLKAREIIDPETGAHFACIRSMRDITELHSHDFYEVFLLAEGRLVHLINGRRTELGPGALVFIRPEDRHCYEKAGEGELCLINLAFSAATLDALSTYLGGLPPDLLAAEQPPGRQLQPPDLADVTARLLELGAVPRHGKLAFRLAVRARLADLFVRSFLSAAEPHQPDLPVWLGELITAMQREENFTAGLSRLHVLAPTTPEHLCRMFRRYLGQTPTGWLNELRLQHAAGLLAQGEQEIMTVSLKAGFENLSHFYHLFRQRFGQSPARYRKAHRRVVVPE